LGDLGRLKTANDCKNHALVKKNISKEKRHHKKGSFLKHKTVQIELLG
jgi:hypothetical protein